MWPLYLLGTPLYYLHYLSWRLLTPIAHFGDWVDDVAAKVANILTWSTIWSYILSYVPNLVAIRDWFYNWWSNVRAVVADWWPTVVPTVQGWVNDAKQLAQALVANVQKELSSLHTSWDNFWTLTYPTLISKNDANALMDTKIKESEPFWKGWQDVKDNVVKFISSPLDWLLERFTDWFLGKE